MYVQDPRLAAAAAQAGPVAQPGGARIPVKLTAVNFESFAPFRQPGAPPAAQPRSGSVDARSGSVSIVNLGIGGSAIPTSLGIGGGPSPRVLPGGGAVASGVHRLGVGKTPMGIGSVLSERDGSKSGMGRVGSGEQDHL